MRAAAAEAPAWAGRAFAVAIAAAALCFDPGAHAADPKRAAILLVVVVALAAWRRGSIATLPPGAAWLFMFVALSALSLAWHGTPGGRDLATTAGAGALLAAACLRPRDESAASARLVAVLVGGGAALWAVAQAVGGARGLGIHGGQGNPNWLGLLLAVSLPLSVSFARQRPPRSGRPRRSLALASVLLQLVALVLAQSRTAWIALAAAGVVTLIAHPAASRTGRGLAIGGAVVLLAAVAAMVHAGAASSLAGRAWIWRHAARAALDSLPFGAGAGAFPALFLERQGQALALLPAGEAARRFVNATTAHCDWLETAVETGLPGVLALGGGLAVAIRACWRGGALAEVATLVSVTVAATADSPMRQPAVLVLVVLAVASAPRPAPAPAPVAPAASPAQPLRALGLLAAAGLLPLAVSTWLGARLASDARDADPQRRAALLSRAADVDRRSGEIAFALGLAELERGAPQAAIADLTRSRPLLPQVATDVALGNALLAAGDPAAAAAAYRRALALHPGSFRAHTNLVVALRRLGQDDEADQHLRIARRLLPGHPALQEL
jgi:tetratricopeptide (TPR) repeat protein